MTVKLGRLEIELAANVARLERDMGKAVHVVSKAHRQMVNSAKWIGASLAAALTYRGFQAWVGQALDTAAGFHQLSQSVAASTEMLSGLAYAAKRNGVPVEQLNVGIRNMVKNLTKAGGPSKEVAAALDQIGLKADSANSTEGWIKAIADAFARMPDSVEKSTAAMAIFGESGAALVPVFNGGAAGIAAMCDEARKFGAEVSSTTARQAAELKAEIEGLKGAFEGLALSIVQTAAPGLKTFFEVWNDEIKNGNDIEGLALAIGTAVSERMALEADKTLKGRLDAATALAKQKAEEIAQFKVKGLTDAWGYSKTDELKAMVAEHEVLRLNAMELERLYLAQLDTQEKKRQSVIREAQERKRLAAIEQESAAAQAIRWKAMDEALKDEAALLKKAADEDLAREKAARDARWKAMDEALKDEAALLKRAADEREQTEERTQKLALERAQELQAAQQRRVDRMRGAVRSYAWQASAAFDQIRDTGKASFSDLANSIISDLGRMALQRMIFEPLLGGIAGAIFGGRSRSPAPNIPGGEQAFSGSASASWARGGVILRRPTRLAAGAVIAGETGRGEAALPLVPTSNGELGVQAVGAQAPAVYVQVIDRRSGGAKPEVQEQRSADGGRLIQVLIRDQVRGGIARGDFDGELRSSFGLARGGVRR